MSSNRPSSEVIRIALEKALASEAASTNCDIKELKKEFKKAAHRASDYLKDFDKNLKKTYDGGKRLDELSKKIRLLSPRFTNPAIQEVNLSASVLGEKIADMISIDLKNADKKSIKKTLSDVKNKVAEFEKTASIIEKLISSTTKEFKMIDEQLGTLIDLHKKTLQCTKEFKENTPDGPEKNFIIKEVESTETLLKKYEDVLRMNNNLHNLTLDGLETLQKSIRVYEAFRKRIRDYLKDPINMSAINNDRENIAAQARFFSQPTQGMTCPTPATPMQRLFHT